MYYQEHNPPHFHVRYNEYKAVISIHDLALLSGKLPKSVRFSHGMGKSTSKGIVVRLEIG